MKIFRCKLCLEKGKVSGDTRKGLREHLKKEHRILTNITNSGWKKGEGYVKQHWWIEEETE